MASIGHLMVGVAAARWIYERQPDAQRESLAKLMVGLSTLSVLPDADAAALLFGVHEFGVLAHRGASHSLVVALAVGTLLTGALRTASHPWYFGVVMTCVLASHALLDCLTDQGAGVALFFPFSGARYYPSWHPIPVAPSGWALFSWPGACATMRQAACFTPFMVYAFSPRGARRVVV